MRSILDSLDFLFALGWDQERLSHSSLDRNPQPTYIPCWMYVHTHTHTHHDLYTQPSLSFQQIDRSPKTLPRQTTTGQRSLFLSLSSSLGFTLFHSTESKEWSDIKKKIGWIWNRSDVAKEWVRADVRHRYGRRERRIGAKEIKERMLWSSEAWITRGVSRGIQRS